MGSDLRRVTAAQFKANCVRLMNEVVRRRRPLLITKRGRPIAKLVPADGRSIDLFGRMSSSTKIVGHIVSPIDVEWTADEENL